MKIIRFQLILGGLLLVLTSNIVMGQRTSIVLGTEDWPPFSYEDKANDRISGLSTEVINATFKMMGISIKENSVFPWARAQQWAFDGILDAVYTASINDERKRYSHFPSEQLSQLSGFYLLKSRKKGACFSTI